MNELRVLEASSRCTEYGVGVNGSRTRHAGDFGSQDRRNTNPEMYGVPTRTP